MRACVRASSMVFNASPSFPPEAAPAIPKPQHASLTHTYTHPCNTGFPAQQVDVLGVLRCDWSEVHKITGIGVTPVVGYLGTKTR